MKLGFFQKKNVIGEITELIRDSFPEISIGSPNRFFSDLEMALATAVACRWVAQMLASIELDSTFAENFASFSTATAWTASLYCFVGASQSEEFISGVSRVIGKRWEAENEIRAVLKQINDKNQPNHLVNAVFALAPHIVKQLKGGPKSRLGHFLKQRSPNEQYSLLLEWLMQCGLNESLLQCFIGSSFKKNAMSKQFVFEPEFWNEVTDLSQSVSVLTAYTVDKPSRQVEQSIRQRY